MKKTKGIVTLFIILVFGLCVSLSAFCSDIPENKKSDKISIAMAADDNYLFPTIVSIISIMENSNKDSAFDFYLLLPGDFQEDSKQKLLSLSKKYTNCKINIINMKNSYENCKTSSHITTPTYYRLGLPSILPNVDKILYMDVDIIVKKDLSELYNTDIEKYYVAGVDQPHTSKISLGKEFLRSVGLVSHDEYINAGILLMNLKKMRENNLENKFMECIEKNKNNKKWRLHDQDIMNEVCFDNIYYLPLKYNALMHYYPMYSDLIIPISQETWDNAYEDSVIVHFSSKNKPWNDLTVPKTELWWEYAKKTVFVKDINEKYLKNN